MNLNPVTTTPPPADDLISGVGDEVKVTIDQWSAGQIGVIDAVIAAGVLAVAFGVGWLVRRLIHRYSERRGGIARSALEALGQLAAVGVLLFAIAIALEILGFGLGPIVVLVLIVVFAVQLLRPVFSNMSTGLVLQLRRAFDLGDFIQTHDETGVVEEISSRTVVLRTRDNRRVHIPNSDVLDSMIINYTHYDRRRSSVDVSLPLRSAPDDLGDELPRRLADAEELLPEPPADVLYTGLDGTQLHLEIRFWHVPTMGAGALARDRVTREFCAMIGGTNLVDTTIALSGDAARPPDRDVTS